MKNACQPVYAKKKNEGEPSELTKKDRHVKCSTFCGGNILLGMGVKDDS